ncbi:hypothetical protein L484_022594 [Morus notabilis]|uniref:Uncharacterized protein n=1 Tax=Morus notabilis TaxID=981085 RepID=W9R8A8_9ROSA|nr:uncharacterized protein LOC21405406 [Morus notabilis]EXB75917.1 hypothetical protein L484_022594 [Morus notabilis]
MAKKKVKKKIQERIDNLPGGYSQQRRSSPPKRRTDFSLFFSNSSDSGSLLCHKVALSKNALNIFHDRNSEDKEFFPSSLVRCSKITDEGSGFSTDSLDTSVVEAEVVNQKALPELHDDRGVGRHTSKVLGILDHTPQKSLVTESKALCASPASVACAGTRKMWWPAEESSRELVKSTATSNHSDQQDLSSDKSTLSVLSRTEDDFLERGRGKRKRKPKIHFDDIIFELKPERKIRRLRIMRYLGLTPPAGSPF